MRPDATLPVGPPVNDPTPAEVPGPRILAGQFVTLLPLDAARDGAELYRISHPASDPGDLWTNMGYGPFDDAAAMRTWLDEQQGRTDPLFFTVIDKATERPIGMTSMQNIVPAMQRLEIGHIWFGAAYQQTEANTEAAYLLLCEAFDNLGYRRVEWKCDTLNARSRRAALRLGFRPEGIFAKHMIVKGRSRDTAWFSIIDDEWPEVRRNQSQWLYEENEPRPSLTQLSAQSQADVFGQVRV